MAANRSHLLGPFAGLALAIAFGLARTVAAEEPTTGFAVIELFTSEGCSSCPPADRLLARLDAWADQNNQPVLALSFHVDYWNRLGWTDPYSSPNFTARQRSYAAAAGTESVYTPQMIVNGSDRFVGSDAKLATEAVAGALAIHQPGGLEIATLPGRADSIQFEYRSHGLADATLSMALVQTAGTQAVTRGENTGRSLRHVNIVREFRSIDPDASGKGRSSIDRPTGLTGPARLVVYAQDRRTKWVLAAASAPVP